MGASASVLSGSDVDEAEARKWAMKENVPFDEIAFRRIQNNENISEQRLKQLLPPKIPKWDHVALCLRGEHVACQQEDGEPLCALSYTNTNFNITDEHMANICPESGCEDRVFELQGTNNIIKFSNPHSLSSTYTIACWFKPSNMLWKTKSTNLGGGSINDDDGVVGYKLISDQEHQSSLISLIHKENYVYIGLCLENQSYIIPTQTKTKLIPNKWQLIVMTCENKNTNNKNLEYYLAVDGQGPKNNGYIDMDTKQSNMMAQRIDYVGDMNNDIGFLSSLYIWDHKLDFQEIYKIFIAETWRFGIDLKLYKNSILDRAKYLMSKLSHVFIGGINPDENGTQQPNEHKPVEQIEEGETKKDGNGNNNEKEEEENYLEFQNLSLFKMIQNLSKWKKTETISQTSSSFDVHSQQKVAQEKEEKEEETEVADFSNVDLLDEELKALLLILPSMRHITAISFSNNDALSLNSLGNPLLEFLAEVLRFINKGIL
jgi:hypothetical protein